MKVDYVELNREGVKQLLQGDEMQALLSQKAASATARLGKGYAYDTRVGVTRCNADIHAVTKKAAKDAINDSTILKAVF